MKGLKLFQIRHVVKKVITELKGLTLSSLNYHCHLHPLQAANCCRNSRLVVDENDLEWVTTKKNTVIFKTFP